MITKDKASEIARAYLKQKNIQPFDSEVKDLKGVRFVGYGTPGDAWIIKYPNPYCRGLCSSYAILISKETGKIVFDGDARDEG